MIFFFKVFLIINIFFNQKQKSSRSPSTPLKHSVTSSNINNEQILLIGNRLANLNATKKKNMVTHLAPPQATIASPMSLKDDAQMVDIISSFLFPISFIIFNIIYWMVYLNMQVNSGN